MILFIGGIFVGMGLFFIGLCVIALCKSAQRADLCRMPDQSPFEPK